MRQLIEHTLVSLDGVIESPDRWAPLGAEGAAFAMSQLDGYDAFVMGRVTYERLSANMGSERGDPYVDRINAMPKYVASRTLRDVSWNAHLLDGDAAEAITQLKQEPGKDLVKYGTSRIDDLLLRNHLVDELHLWYLPVVVGTGQRPAVTGLWISESLTTSMSVGSCALRGSGEAVVLPQAGCWCPTSWLVVLGVRVLRRCDRFQATAPSRAFVA